MNLPEFVEEYERIIDKNLKEVGLGSRYLRQQIGAPPLITGHYITRPIFNKKYLNFFPTKERVGEIKTNSYSTIIQSAALNREITHLNLIAYNEDTKEKLKKIKKSLETELNIPVNIDLIKKSVKLMKKWAIPFPILEEIQLL